MAKELTVVERAAQALAPAASETTLRELAGKYADVTEVKSSTDVKMVRPAIAELRTTRTAITKAGKDARDDANAFAKAVIAEERRLIGIIDPEESRLKGLVDAYEAERARIKAEEEARERQRVAAIQDRLNQLRNATIAMHGATSAVIAEALARLQSLEIVPADFQEYTDEAAVLRATAIRQLEQIRTEAEQAEAEAKRLEQERQRREAEQRAEAERLAADRAELERQRREAEEARAAIEAQQAELERKRMEIQRQQEAAERAERERQEAAARAERERLEAAERKRLQAEAAEKARREAEAEAARREAERQRKEQARIQALRQSPLVKSICRAAATHHGADPGRWADLAPVIADILDAHQ